MLRAVKYKFSEAPQQYWDFVHEHGTIYQSRLFLGFLAKTSREPSIVAVLDGESIVGGCAITLGPNILGRAFRAGVYFGPVVADTTILADVFNLIADTLRKICISYSITVWPEHAEILAANCNLSGFAKQEIEFLHWDISKPIDELWQSLPKDKKASVKRARRDGVVIQEIESKQCVRQFYDLHVMTMGRGGRTPHRLAYYEILFDMLKAEGLIKGFLALHPESRQPIAGVTLLLGMRGEAVHLAIGHNYEFRKLRGSDLLMWQCLEFLKTNGFTMFDLAGLPKGDSTRAEGIRHFKTAWAGNNGRRRPSYILSRAVWGLNPNFINGIVSFIKGLRKFVCKRS
jgi:hypothetical protein